MLILYVFMHMAGECAPGNQLCVSFTFASSRFLSLFLSLFLSSSLSISLFLSLSFPLSSPSPDESMRVRVSSCKVSPVLANYSEFLLV